MAIRDISFGLRVQDKEPIDSRMVVADQAARLAIPTSFAYEGLVVYQEDNNNVYVLTVDEGSDQNDNWTVLGGENSAPQDTDITISAGTGLTGGGDFSTNQASAETITLNVDTGVALNKILRVTDSNGLANNDWLRASTHGIYGTTTADAQTSIVTNAAVDTALGVSETGNAQQFLNEQGSFVAVTGLSANDFTNALKDKLDDIPTLPDGNDETQQKILQITGGPSNPSYSWEDSEGAYSLPIASASVRGGVRIPSNSDIAIDGDNANLTLKDLAASKITSGVFGRARISTDTPTDGQYLQWDNTNSVMVWADATAALPIAANATLGGVIVETSSDIDVDATGKLTLGDLAASKITSGVLDRARISTDTPTDNQVLTWDGTNNVMVWDSGSQHRRTIQDNGTDITDQDDMNFVSPLGASVNGSSIEISIDEANATTEGTVTAGAQTFGGNKTFNDNVTVVDDLTVNGDITLGDTNDDTLLVNADAEFANDVTIGSSQSDSLVINSNDIYLPNVPSGTIAAGRWLGLNSSGDLVRASNSGGGGGGGEQFANQQDLEDFITNKSDFRSDIGVAADSDTFKLSGSQTASGNKIFSGEVDFTGIVDLLGSRTTIGSQASDDLVINSNDVHMPNTSAGTIVAGGVLGLDNNNDIVKDTIDLAYLGVTASSSELNLLDDVTGLVKADFTKLAAITASATDLNKTSTLPTFPDTSSLSADRNYNLTWDDSADAFTWTQDSGGGGGASALDGLSDVDITSVADEQILQYNNDDSEWQNLNIEDSAIADFVNTGFIEHQTYISVRSTQQSVNPPTFEYTYDSDGDIFGSHGIGTFWYRSATYQGKSAYELVFSGGESPNANGAHYIQIVRGSDDEIGYYKVIGYPQFSNSGNTNDFVALETSVVAGTDVLATTPSDNAEFQINYTISDAVTAYTVFNDNYDGLVPHPGTTSGYLKDDGTWVDLVDLTAAQTIGGVKTFSDSPVFSTGFSVTASQTIDFNNNRLQEVADPTSGKDAANRDYVQSLNELDIDGTGLSPQITHTLQANQTVRLGEEAYTTTDLTSLFDDIYSFGSDNSWDNPVLSDDSGATDSLDGFDYIVVETAANGWVFVVDNLDVRQNSNDGNVNVSVEEGTSIYVIDPVWSTVSGTVPSGAITFTTGFTITGYTRSQLDLITTETDADVRAWTYGDYVTGCRYSGESGTDSNSNSYTGIRPSWDNDTLYYRVFVSGGEEIRATINGDALASRTY